MNRSSNLHNLCKRVVCCLLAVVLLFVVVSMTGSVVVFRLLFGRGSDVHPLELTYADVDAARYPRRVMDFSSGGNTLRGYLYERPDPAGVVIVVNGIFSGADRHLSEIVYFVDHGWQVFAFDGTGVGQSQGDGIKGLPQTKLDLLAAVDALRADGKTAALPLVLYGHSVGGYAAVACLAQTQEVAAVVCMAGFNTPVETMHYHAQKRVGVLADLEYPFLWLQNWVLFGKDGDSSALDALNRTRVPVALIEGSGDAVVPAEIGLGRYRDQWENANVEYVLVDAPYRNTHSSLWLSEDAARAAQALTAAQPAALTAEQRWSINGVDPAFMAYVLDFFEAAVRPS